MKWNKNFELSNENTEIIYQRVEIYWIIPFILRRIKRFTIDENTRTKLRNHRKEKFWMFR